MRRTIGQIGYEAYGAAADWKTYDGRPMPTWDDLGAAPAGLETRRRREVAALAICDASPFAKPDASPDAWVEGEKPGPVS